MTTRTSPTRTCLTIVLAAGEGTRMRSPRPKVLHAIGGRTLLAHVLAALPGDGDIAVVVGPGQEAVSRAVTAAAANADIFIQSERLGTAHAVLAARERLARGADDVLVAFADTPLVTPATFTRLREALAEGAGIAVLGFRPADPSGYGRLVVENGKLVAIREEKDASAAERAITLCNAGVMAIAGRHAIAILDQIGDQNAKHEFYLTDAVEVAAAMGLDAVALETDADEVLGVNTQSQLAQAEAVLQRRLRMAALDAGVMMVAPDTVHLAADTRIAAGATIEPYVVFGPGVEVAQGATVRAFSHLEGASVGRGATVGPYARLRPGARIDAGARIGNFVEIKEAHIEDGAKVNHLTYIGDARVGAGANIGAGTITCNYDGENKHRTDIGAGAFVGSNSSLVAPLKIGDGAYVGSGSVITRNVPADALALGRGQQVVKAGWVARLRALKGAGKTASHE